MTPHEPSSPNDDPAPGGEHDALRRLEQRLDRASEAAERLISEAARAAAATARAGSGAGEPGDGETSPGQSAGPGQSAAPGQSAGPGQSAAPGQSAGPGQSAAPGQSAGEAAPDQGQSAKPPPAGWQLPKSDGSEADRSPEVELVANLLQSLRDLIPADLQERLASALRELLLALRALIDWYVERMERRRAQPAEVEDIPIL